MDPTFFTLKVSSKIWWAKAASTPSLDSRIHEVRPSLPGNRDMVYLV